MRTARTLTGGGDDSCILSCEIITLPVIWSEIYFIWIFYNFWSIKPPPPKFEKKFQLKKFEFEKKFNLKKFELKKIWIKKKF